MAEFKDKEKGKERRNDLFKRLTQLFRGGPSVKRKVRAFRTPTTSTATDVFKKSYSQVYSNALNAYGQYDRMSRYADFCFSGDTLVYTTNGVKTFKELSDLCAAGTRINVYSYDLSTKTVKIAEAHSARLARDGEQQELLRVTFDDGGYVDVTPDHSFLLKGGEYKQAQHLVEGMSLQPFYCRDITGDGYKWIYTNDRERSKGGWISEHLMVMEHFIGRRINDDEVVHHRDFDRGNNSLDNLQLMTHVEHDRYHAQLNNVNKFGKPAQAHSKWMYENKLGQRADVTFDSILQVAIEVSFVKKKVIDILGADHNVINRRLRAHGFKNWNDFSAQKGVIQQFLTHQAIANESCSPTIEKILEVAPNYDTLQELCCALKCTTNAVSRRLHSCGYGSWTQFKTGIVPAKRGPRSDPELYQKICNVYKRGMTQVELGTAVNSTKNKVLTSIINAGFKSYSEWTDNFQNHKVVSVVKLQGVQHVYNITVEGYHNLAVGSKNISDSSDQREYSMVFCKQSEMEYTPELSSALDVYSEEATSVDDKSSVLHVYSNNPKIQQLLDELFHDTINVEHNLTPWTRNLVKYGDFFLFIDIHPEMGVLNVFPMPINEVERDEGWDPQNPLAVRFRWVTQGNQILESWQVAHFRLVGNDSFLPYGSSVLESGRRIWRQLILIEDAMLVYRVVRSPERRVFYIDVGTVPTEEIPNYMEAAQSKLKRSPVIDKATGRIDLRYNPLSVDEDYFIPVRGSESGTKIDSLAGGQHVSDIADVEYIQKKLFAAIKVPRAYLGYDESLSSKATLAQEDIRFSRSINKIQQVLISELTKIAIIHLFAHGYEGDDLADFTIFLSNPSTVAQQQKLELWRTKFEIAGTVPEGLTDRDFLRKEIFQLTDDQIDEIKEGRLRDRIEDLELEASEIEGNSPAGGGGRGSGGGLGGLPDSGFDVGGDDLGDEEDDSGTSDTGGSGDSSSGEEDLFAGDAQKGKELLTGLEDFGDEEDDVDETDDQAAVTEPAQTLSLGKALQDIDRASKSTSNGAKKAPASTTPLSKYLYDRGRLRTHGARKTHMPNFKDMVSYDADPHDSRHFNANPFAEGKLSGSILDFMGPRKKARLSAEMKTMLHSLSQRLDSKGRNAKPAVLTELSDIVVEDDDVILLENMELDAELELPLTIDDEESES